MGILGLTNGSDGKSLQRLPVLGKVAIGEAPDKTKGKNYPSKLDHFTFMQKTMVGGEAVWVPNDEVIKVHGSNPRDIGIVFLDDNPENVFKTQYAWWGGLEWKCKGELVQLESDPAMFGMQAIRKTPEHPEGEHWPTAKSKAPPCGDGCPELEEGKCKPSGDLYFFLEKFPNFGGVWRLHTTSYQSIRNIANGLQQIRSLLGGRLGGIRVTLHVQPEKVNYRDDGDKKKSSTAHILSINVTGKDLPKMLGKMTEFSRLFQDTRKLLSGQTIVIEEDDDERAKEIVEEFHPDNREPAQLPAAVVPQKLEDVDALTAIREACSDLGYNSGKMQMLIGQNQGKLGELAAKLKAEAASKKQPPATEAAKPEEAKPTAAKKEPAEKNKTKGFNF